MTLAVPENIIESNMFHLSTGLEMGIGLQTISKKFVSQPMVSYRTEHCSVLIFKGVFQIKAEKQRPLTW